MRGNALPLTVLVVEDDSLLRLSISGYLRDGGFQVLEAASTEDAQALLRAGHGVDLVFTDVMLGPGPSGIELCRWVRAHYPGVRTLITSGVIDTFEEAASVCDGAFFSKPYTHQTVAAEIRRLFGLADRHP